MKEATVSVISGIHFGHLKAIAKSEPLLNFEAIVCHIPYRTDYSLTDWKVAINTIIEKKGKGNQVGNLRTINLIEVNFNFNSKIMAREILRCRERNGLLSKE